MSLYFLTVATTVCIYVLLAIGLNIIVGYAGQPSLGHAAFFGIGAYSAAIAMTRWGWPFWLSLATGAASAAAAGALVGLVSLRLKEDYLAITTIGVNFVVVSAFLYWPFFGQALGIGGIPLPALWGQPPGKLAYLVLVVLLTAGAAAADWWLRSSWLGAVLRAVREDETAALSIGVNLAQAKVAAFVMGTGLAGLAGGLYAPFMGFISPGDFGFILSITILAMVVVGGAGALRGAVAGAVLLGALPEAVRFVGQYRMLVYGGVLILILRFEPAGLLGDESRLWKAMVGGFRWLGGRLRRQATRPVPERAAKG